MELVDVPDSKSGSRKGVGVRFPPPALNKMITKNTIQQINRFIKSMPDVEKSIKSIVINYLKLFNENDQLKQEISVLTKSNEELLTDCEDRGKMIEELEREIEQLTLVH